jgi:hypothetical protein
VAKQGGPAVTRTADAARNSGVVGAAMLLVIVGLFKSRLIAISIDVGGAEIDQVLVHRQCGSGAMR